MSFDGQTASTLDVVDVGIPLQRRQSQRPRRVPARMKSASTVQAELMPEMAARTPTTIDALLVSPALFSIETDIDEFLAWLEGTGISAVLELVAGSIARHFGVAGGLKVTLETEAEDPSAQRAVVLVPVAAQAEDALDKLFAFTSSAWWLSVVRGTRNAIIVDIQPA